MLQVDDLIEPGAKQILFTRLPSFPWPHVAPRKSFLSERITNQICKESPSAKQFPGKLDFHNAPFLDSKSRTWEFFTDDQLQTRFRDLAAQRARVLHLSLAPMEGVGNAGCPLHPPRQIVDIAWFLATLGFGPQIYPSASRRGYGWCCRSPRTHGRRSGAAISAMFIVALAAIAAWS